MSELQMSACGTISDGVHVRPLRVVYEDTDASGVVYHANYLRFIKHGRSDHLRCLGAIHIGLSGSDQIRFTVSRCKLHCCPPACLDDLLQVFTSMLELSFATVRVLQVVRRDDIDLFRAKVWLAFVDNSGRSGRFLKAVQSTLSELPACDLADLSPSNVPFQHLQEASP